MALTGPGCKRITTGTEEGVNTLHLRVTSILTRMDPGGVTATGLPNSSVHPRPLRVPFEELINRVVRASGALATEMRCIARHWSFGSVSWFVTCVRFADRAFADRILGTPSCGRFADLPFGRILSPPGGGIPTIWPADLRPHSAFLRVWLTRPAGLGLVRVGPLPGASGGWAPPAAWALPRLQPPASSIQPPASSASFL